MAVPSLILWRPSRLSGLFEEIEIGAAGRSHDALYAEAKLAAARGRLGTKGLGASDPLHELANGPAGYFKARSKTEAQAWLGRVAGAAPMRWAKLTAEKGPALLDSTATARCAAAAYLARIAELAGDDPSPEPLLAKASKEERQEAQRVAGFAGVLRYEDAEPQFLAAALAIAMFSPEIEPGLALRGANPLEQPDLMHRVQLIVDRLRFG
jgi:hypothetical protein